MSAQKCIVFVINSMTGGGAERVTSALLEGVGKHFDEDSVHLVLLDREEIRHPIPANVQVHQLDARHNLIRSIVQLFRVLRRLSPDIVISALERSNAANVVCRTILRYRAIVCEHVFTTGHLGGGISGSIKRLVVRLTYRHADRVIAVSEGIGEDLVTNYGVARERVVVVNNPIDAERIVARSLEPTSIETPDHYIVAIGRLVPAKNFPLLIEAVAGSPNRKLLILGEGPEREALGGLIQRLGLTDRVQLCGYIVNPYPIVAGADFFVASSNVEGFPMALLEAMALGRPIVATNCPTGPEEILSPSGEQNNSSNFDREFGMLVPMNAPDALTAALNRMADPALRTHYSAKSLERVSSFSASAAYRGYIETIRDVLGDGNTTGSFSPKAANISVVGLRGIPNVMGGIETHCEQLYPRIAKIHPANITVFARRPYMGEHASFIYKGARVIPIWALKSKYLEAVVHTAWAIVLVRFHGDADIVHIHGIGPGIWAPLARLFGFKVVVTHHAKDYDRAKWNALARFVLRTGEWVALRCANSVIVVDNALCEALKRDNPILSRKLVHISNGGNHLDAYDPADTRSVLEELGLTPGNYILAVGRLVPEKGFDVVIDACAGSDQRPPPLVIVGRSDHNDSFSRKLVDRGSQNVIFAGFQPQSRLRELYENSALFVSPSYLEGNPIAPLEAISLGARVLLSDIEPHKQLGLETKHYFPVGDVAALREKLADPFEVFRVTDESVRARFDWDHSAAKTVAVYRRLIEPSVPDRVVDASSSNKAS